jgi:hypothetical protein
MFPVQERHNTETHTTDLLYSLHHIGQYTSGKLHEARPLVLLQPPTGNDGRKQQDAQDLFKLQLTPNLCELYTEFYSMQKQSSHVQNKLHDG